jgi:hypothetical protein
MSTYLSVGNLLVLSNINTAPVSLPFDAEGVRPDNDGDNDDDDNYDSGGDDNGNNDDDGNNDDGNNDDDDNGDNNDVDNDNYSNRITTYVLQITTFHSTNMNQAKMRKYRK